MSNSMRKENFEDIQEEHRKILETIESALQKLNSVSLKLMNKIDTNIHQLNEKKICRNEHIYSSNTISKCRNSVKNYFNWKKQMLIN